MGKTRIICLVSNDLNHDQRMQKTCASLQAAGYAVTLVGRKRRTSKPLLPQPYEQVRVSLWAEKGKLFYFFLQWRLLWYLLRHPFDIVCAVDLDTILPAWLATRLKGKQLVYDAHEYFTEVPEVINRPMVQGTWRWVERFAVPKTDARYTVSEGLAQRFQQRYQVPFTVVRNVPKKPIRNPRGSAEPYLLYQGALNDGRGLEQLFLAMYEIDIPLYLAGEGDLSRKLRELVVAMDLQNKVFFKGQLPPRELRQLTAQATVGINLLEDKGLSYYYSLSNKFFDYVAAGVPQLCIRFPEYDRHNQMHEVALMVDDLKAFTLYSAINQLLDDEALYHRLQRNCKSAIQEWNWEKESKALVALYNSMSK